MRNRDGRETVHHCLFEPLQFIPITNTTCWKTQVGMQMVDGQETHLRRAISASLWYITHRNVWPSLSHPETSNASGIPARPPPLHGNLAAAAKPHGARQDGPWPHWVFPFSDYGHTFSSQSGICKGNYASHQDEILPKKEVKTRGCRRKYWFLCRSSQSTYLAFHWLSVCSEVTENLWPKRADILSRFLCHITLLFFIKWSGQQGSGMLTVIIFHLRKHPIRPK